ncbi:penicillin-binding protein 1A [Desulfovibrio psychrotolerans]|uniref:Penicillin-binding protein 1A n=1 Tax=Desulfovibrio psychrotolerans TaxID=415242 RepID=A0A7J0BUS9_9BACT|nr:PBP1A family penicillin-binding protein [Desulfovibrio psychrotolerans]GFM36942.1 penicillin-binding protein [Desulfovibrio psychrotolerans]
MKKFFLYGIIMMMLCVALGALGLSGIYWWASKDLPGFTKIADYRPPLVTTVYARDGAVLGYFYREKRFLVSLNDMASYLPMSFLAAEDDSFYRHDGIDFRAIARAFVRNMQAGSIRQGGSTITQQIIKQLLLTSEKKYERKIKEAILAYRLERYLSKDEILTIYLNQIYLGAGAYGVEAAARTYFGKHSSELTLAESAMMAGLTQSPSKYNPLRQFEFAKARQTYVLGRMLSLQWITQAEHDEALAQELAFKSMDDPSWTVGSWYLEEVRRRLIDFLSEENMQKLGITLPRYGEDAVYESGLHIHTAVDLQHQAAAEQALRKGLEDSSKRRGWDGPLRTVPKEEFAAYLEQNGVAPETLADGRWHRVLVTAVDAAGANVRIGGYKGYIPVSTMGWCRPHNLKLATDQVPSIKDARQVLNAGDVVWASVAVPKDSKSGWNPLALGEGDVLPMALEQYPAVQGALVSIEPENGDVVALVGGYSFADSQFNRATQAKRQPGSAFKPVVYATALDNGYTAASMLLDAPIVYMDAATSQIWRPENFEGVFYGPTLFRTALVKSRNLCTIRVAQKIGIPAIAERAKAMGLEGPFPHNLSVSLGATAVSPINLTEAYTSFARGGTWINHRMIRSIQDAWGDSIATFQSEPHEAMSPQTAYIMSSILKEVVSDGTGQRLKVLNRPIAGKTGTTNDEQDAWFVGFTPYLVTVAYVGFDQVAPMGKWETGARAASPIVRDYRMAVEETYPPMDFPVPPGIVQVQIDGKTGQIAGPGSSESYFLPFKQGSQPSVVSGEPVRRGEQDDVKSGEDLLKQMF